MRILITGANGLIGGEAFDFFSKNGHEVLGIDNNARALYFGVKQDDFNLKIYNIDICDKDKIFNIISITRPDVIIHAAAQPSHDLAARIPILDFTVNAMGTLYLLEAARQLNKEIIFVYLSTNKVYGDSPNRLRLRELPTRWDYEPCNYWGISESQDIDQSKHSLFGVSKLSADIMVQEYGRYFGMKTCCLRCGCLTGGRHRGAELHGFLSYLVKCNLENKKYNIYGYKGKQVRDNLHSIDVVLFINEFIKNPKVGEVYNLGGGRENSCSILEAMDIIEHKTGKQTVTEYIEQPRVGDHICYVSDLTKCSNDFPRWKVTQSLDDIIEDIIGAHNA